MRKLGLLTLSIIAMFSIIHLDAKVKLKESKAETYTSFTSGNRELTNFGLKFNNAIKISNEWDLGTYGKFNIGKSQGVVYEENYLFGFKAYESTKLRIPVRRAYRTDWMRDRFAGVISQWNVGFGAEVEAYKSKKSLWFFEPWILYRNERRLPDDEVKQSPLVEVIFRHNYKISDNVMLDGIYRFYDDLNDIENSSFELDPGVKLLVTKRVSVRGGYWLRFINLPSQGFKRSDTKLSFSVVYDY